MAGCKQWFFVCLLVLFQTLVTWEGIEEVKEKVGRYFCSQKEEDFIYGYTTTKIISCAYVCYKKKYLKEYDTDYGVSEVS